MAYIKKHVISGCVFNIQIIIVVAETNLTPCFFEVEEGMTLATMEVSGGHRGVFGLLRQTDWFAEQTNRQTEVNTWTCHKLNQTDLLETDKNEQQQTDANRLFKTDKNRRA